MRASSATGTNERPDAARADDESWYRHASIIGRVAALADDAELTDIDRLARRYTGEAFRNRTGRRVSAWIEPERWHGWEGGGPWP